MPWRIIEVPEDQSKETDLIDSEMLGVSILLSNYCVKRKYSKIMDVYFRARKKIYPIGEKIIKNQ